MPLYGLNNAKDRDVRSLLETLYNSITPAPPGGFVAADGSVPMTGPLTITTLVGPGSFEGWYQTNMDNNKFTKFVIDHDTTKAADMPTGSSLSGILEMVAWTTIKNDPTYKTTRFGVGWDGTIGTPYLPTTTDVFTGGEAGRTFTLTFTNDTSIRHPGFQTLHIKLKNTTAIHVNAIVRIRLFDIFTLLQPEPLTVDVLVNQA